MKYLMLEDHYGIIHVVWCGMVDDAVVAAWQRRSSLRWCACEVHVDGVVLPTETRPTCVPCARNMHEHAESRYDGPEYREP